MSTLFRMTLAATITGFLLSGCADHPSTRTTRPVSTTTSASSAAASNARTNAAEKRERTTSEKTPGAKADLPENTGIAACDDYLASYLACHRAAKIFVPSQLQSRYEAMRTSLLRDSQNPDIRPQLGARCNSLATQLRQALHGKACAPDPAPAGSSSTP